jgi:uncharacterized membrane protein YeiH
VIELWEIIGTLVFCVSGAIAGRQKDMDWFGMFIMALVTGAGGGMLRSLLIGDVPPVFLKDPTTFLLASLATVVALAGAELWNRVHRVVSVVDALGLGLFTIAGIRVAQRHGLPWWSCVALGVISATFGGVLRDVLRNEIPLVLRKEIYATACLIGGLALYGLDLLGAPKDWSPAIASALIVSIRLLAIRYAIHQSVG